MGEAQTVTVDALALRQILVALNGPDHAIRELQVTRGPIFDNPIDKILAQFNEQMEAARAGETPP